MNDELAARQRPISLRLAGRPVKHICLALGRSEAWLMVSFLVRTRLSPGREHRLYISMIRVWESLPLQGQPGGIYETAPKLRLKASHTAPSPSLNKASAKAARSHFSPSHSNLMPTARHHRRGRDQHHDPPESRHGDRLE